MRLETFSRPRAAALALLALALIAAGLLAWRHWRATQRPEFVLINETGQHNYDLAFKMSLKLAERKSSIENALVLLNALPPGQTIEATAAGLLSRLRVGARRNGRGILYLYSARENLMKVEVSYALEGVIPDLYCRRLEEAAKTYMLSEVPQDFISELIITTNLLGVGSKQEGQAPARPTWLSAEFLSGGGGALTSGYHRTLADYQGAIRRLPPTDWHEFLPSPDPRVSADRYLSSLAAGIGDPRLPLLTEGSQVFRAVVPRSDAQQRRIYEYFAAASPHELVVAGDFAALVPQPDHSNLPLVMRRGIDHVWYVDEAKAWTYFHRFEDDRNFFVKYADNPLLPGLRALRARNTEYAIYGTHVPTPTAPAYPYSLAAAIRAGERRIQEAPADAAVYAALADLYLFESDWLHQAIALYEKAAALAPQDLAYHWRLVDAYLNASQVEKMLDQLKLLAERLPGDQQTQAWYREYRRQYDFGGN